MTKYQDQTKPLTNQDQTKTLTMKLNSTSLALAVVCTLPFAAGAQIQFNVAGASTMRKIVDDRIKNVLLMPGYTRTGPGGGNQQYTYTGILTNVAGLNGSAITFRTVFNGSADGLLAVQGNTPENFFDTNAAPDAALSDVFPASTTPALSDGQFQVVTNVGVVSFVFAANNSLGLTNITRDQAQLLFQDSGSMPASFLGGNNPNPVYLIGRTPDSGTRISCEKVVGFTSSELIWTNAGSAAVPNWQIDTLGNSSGGYVALALQTNSAAMGYLGLADYNSVSAQVTALSYNGVPYSSANVTNGAYAVWGYEHAALKSGYTAATPQYKIFQALVGNIVDVNFQRTNTLYVGNFEVIADMNVKRNGDGATIFGKTF